MVASSALLNASFLTPKPLLQRKTVPCTKSTSGIHFPSSSRSFPSLQTQRFNGRTLISASFKENIDRFKKALSDFTRSNYWLAKAFYDLVNVVNALEPEIQKLSDEQLTTKTSEFKKRLSQGDFLWDIQCEAFAVVREAARRTIDMRHFDVQITGGLVLHEGCIAEMQTGEGKTLVSTLAAYLNALTGDGVHVVTVNDYLAQRDAEWMGSVHRFLGLSVGLIQEGMTAEEKRTNYQCDITYISISVLGFDYLRDNLARNSDQLVMRWPKPFHFAIIDDFDTILIDDGTEPLLMMVEDESVPVAQISYLSLFKLYPKLSGMTATAKTVEEFRKILYMPVTEVPTNLPNIRKDLPTQAFSTARVKWEHVSQEVEHIFRQGRPVLIGTTSVEDSEHLSDLLKKRNIPHLVLNARPEDAATEAEIIALAGKRHHITISTNMAGRGTDIILGGDPKMLARQIIAYSLLYFLTGEAPNVDVLDTKSLETIWSDLKVKSSSMDLLANAAFKENNYGKIQGKNWTLEEAKSIVSESLKMPLQELRKLLHEQSETLGSCIVIAYFSVLKCCEIHCAKERSEVERLGGLHVIGTSLHKSRRIDDQLRGRAGRQGDPGSTQFMVSLQDEMFRTFDSDTNFKMAKRLISKLTNDEDKPTESDRIVKKLLKVQVSVEKHFLYYRKAMYQFEEVYEVQRKEFYKQRQLIFTGDYEIVSQHIFQYMQAVVDEIVSGNADPLMHPKYWNLSKLLEEFLAVAGKLLDDSFAAITEEDLHQSLEQLPESKALDIDNFHLPNLPKAPDSFRGIHGKTSSFNLWLDICSHFSIENGKYRPTTRLLGKYLGDVLIASYLNIVQESGYHDADIRKIEREILLKTMDSLWSDHLVNMKKLLSEANVEISWLGSFLQGFGRSLQKYNFDGYQFFISMVIATPRLTVESLVRYWSSHKESQEQISS